MLKKTLTYTNLDGKTITEDFYFNMTKAELIKLNLKEGEGFQDYLTKIVESGDGAAIIENFEKLVRLSYGVRTADGKFKKDPDDFDAFMATEAYSDFFLELVTDAKASADFVNAVMPSELVEEAEAAKAQLGTRQIQDVVPREVSNSPLPNVETATESLLKKDPRKMSKAELMAAYREKNSRELDKPVNPYKGMPLDEAMKLPAAEFEVWVDVNQ